MPIVPDQPNQLSNPGAEGGALTPWTIGVGTPAVTAVGDAHAGAFVFRFPNASTMQQVVAATVTTGQTWHVGAWVRPVGTPDCAIAIDMGPGIKRVRFVVIDPGGDGGRGVMEWRDIASNVLRSLPLRALGYDLTAAPEWIPLFMSVQSAAAASSWIVLVGTGSATTGSWDMDDFWFSQTSFKIPHSGFHVPGPPLFTRGYYDDIHGTIHRDTEVARDLDDRLRREDDLDEPDRDDLRRGWTPRTEQPGEEP